MLDPGTLAPVRLRERGYQGQPGRPNRRELFHAEIPRSVVKSMTKYMTWRAMVLALTAVSVYGQEQAKTDLGDDFVPGNRVIFATDFSRDPLGGFPRKFDLKSGNVAVADVKGNRVLRVNSSGE